MGKVVKEMPEKEIRPLGRLYASLSASEISCCTVAFIASVGYSYYCVYLASRKYLSKASWGYLERGWFGNEQYRYDASDTEWDVFSLSLLYTLPWVGLHFIGSQVLRRYDKGLLVHFNAALSTIYLTRCLGANGTLCMLLQPVIMFVVRQTNSTLLVWTTSVSCLVSNLVPFWNPLSATRRYLDDKIGDDPSLAYMSTVTWHWINCRCVSYCLDVINGEVKLKTSGKLNELLELIAYAWYLPNCISGPILLFRKFHSGLHSDANTWTRDRVTNLGLQILRYSFWLWFAHFVNHFFYQAALSQNVNLMQYFDMWTLTGVCFLVSQFFHLKYVVFYGFARVWAVEDGIVDAPPHPKCISRIHLYSDMWRHFDVGLHEFLKFHIYIPIVNKRNQSTLAKVAASMIVFAYIFVWHGVILDVLIWSFCNYVSVSLEQLARCIGKNEGYASFERSLLSPRGIRRFHGLLGAPLWVCSALANFYFVMGHRAADLFVTKAFLSWPIGTPFLFLMAYAGAQVSIEAKNWELSAKDRRKLKDL